MFCLVFFCPARIIAAELGRPVTTSVPCCSVCMCSDVQCCTVHVSSTVQCMYSVVQCLYRVCQSGTGRFWECQQFLRPVVLAHEGHQGIFRTKQLISEKVWFVNIDKQVEEFCKGCIPCQVSFPRQQHAPLNTDRGLKSAWTILWTISIRIVPNGYC